MPTAMRPTKVSASPSTLLMLLPLTLLGAVMAKADAPPAGSLTGSYAIGGKTPVDPDPSEAANTHLRLYLVGEAAEALFHSMPVDAAPSLCNDGMSKRIDQMECAQTEHGYQCWFAIDIEAQTITGDWAC